ncbi:hypothetical protein AX17_006998 [Amanita inopinata Kibby_2008]|nr:hypothetical protein AX17_006998 [Amanita inopinata Kibby_2008]
MMFKTIAINLMTSKIVEKMKPRLGEFLKKYGYNSREELDEEVRKILKGSALDEYLAISEKYGKSDGFVSTLFQITSIVSVSSGVFIGSLVALGIMTGGAAWAAIGAIGAVLGVIAGIAMIFEIFEGAEERSNMRKAIHDLSLERVKARAALEGMKAISNWVENIKLWLDEPLISENEEIMKKKIEGDFENDFNRSKRTYVVDYLTQRDRERGAWTNEDLNWRSGSEDILGTGSSGRKKREAGLPSDSDEETSPEDPIDIEYLTGKESGSLELLFLSSDEKSCTALDPDVRGSILHAAFERNPYLPQNNKWTITYESGLDKETDPLNPELSEFRFSLKNLTSGKVLEHWKLNMLRHSIS